MVFEKLKGLIGSDVETRNKFRHKDEPIFRYQDANATQFSVVVEETYTQLHDSVVFALKGDEIIAMHGAEILFRATVTLSNDGDCKAKVNGEECDLWQVRKMALEDFLFKKYF